MITVLSPSKTLDYDKPPQTAEFTEPAFMEDTAALVDVMKGYDSNSIGKLMSISEKLSDLNYDRYQSFDAAFTPANAKQALLAFKGDVYTDFRLDEYGEDDFRFAQTHVRILSGLYGVLRPLDLIAPYRLEMGTKLKTERGKNLYEFWGTTISGNLNSALDGQGDDIILNLASNEYFKAVDRAALAARIVNVAFLEERKGKWKPITFNLKKARGTMTDWIVRNRVDDVEAVKEFAEDRYYFSAERSSANELVFLRNPA